MRTKQEVERELEIAKHAVKSAKAHLKKITQQVIEIENELSNMDDHYCAVLPIVQAFRWEGSLSKPMNKYEWFKDAVRDGCVGYKKNGGRVVVYIRQFRMEIGDYVLYSGGSIRTLPERYFFEMYRNEIGGEENERSTTD